MYSGLRAPRNLLAWNRGVEGIRGIWGVDDLEDILIIPLVKDQIQNDSTDLCRGVNVLCQSSVNQNSIDLIKPEELRRGYAGASSRTEAKRKVLNARLVIINSHIRES